MALGWHIGFKDSLPNVRWHNGGTAGFASFVATDLDKDVGVVVLANTLASSVDNLGAALLHVARGEPGNLDLKARPAVVNVSEAALDRCTGRFALAPTFVITVTREGGALFAQAPRQPRFRLWPSSETTFHVHVVDATLEFEIGPDGRAKRVVLHQGGKDSPGDRVE